MRDKNDGEDRPNRPIADERADLGAATDVRARHLRDAEETTLARSDMDRQGDGRANGRPETGELPQMSGEVALSAIRALIQQLEERADVLRERTEPDASSHYFRNGQVWAYQQVAKELEALCPAPAAEEEAR